MRCDTSPELYDEAKASFTNDDGTESTMSVTITAGAMIVETAGGGASETVVFSSSEASVLFQMMIALYSEDDEE